MGAMLNRGIGGAVLGGIAGAAIGGPQPIAIAGGAAIGGVIGAATATAPSWPFKIAKYDPKTNSYKYIYVAKTFADAYAHPEGSHVVQTHGTAEEVENVARGIATPAALSRPDAGAKIGAAGVGYLLAGAPGAAVGAAIGGKAAKRMYELPVPIVTPKSPHPLPHH
jgi:hypothetical protein